jgi:LuxR family maltose regulon positive regulatory protein
VSAQRAFLLLDTKLEPPPLPGNVVERSRMTAAVVDEHLPVALIVAGPGYGKTIAARQIVARSERPFGWVSLDAIDDRPPGFWAYVIEAFRRSTGVGEEAAAMLSDGSLSEAWLNALLCDLHDSAAPVTLVLDDLHVVRSAEALSALQFFVERLPHNVQLVATSRVDPRLPIGRWRLQQRVRELRQADLRFTVDEVARLVDGAEGLELHQDDIETIVERTEGWPAGVQLALLSLRGRPNASRFVEQAFHADRMVADYLLSEVLDRLTPSDRQLLLDLSVLSDFDSDLAMFLTRRPDAAHRALSLEAADLLVLPVDEARQRFRFHHLIRELLHQELRWRHPDRLPLLQARAAQYLAEHDRPSEAVDHYIAAARHDEAFEIVAGSTLAALDEGDAPATRRWLGQFSTDFIVGSAGRILGYSRLLIVSGQPEGALEWLDALDGMETVGPQAAEALAQRTILHVWLGDYDFAGRTAEEFLSRWGDQPFNVPVIDRIPGMLTRLAIHAGDLDRAERWLASARAVKGNDVVEALIPMALGAQLAEARGDLRGADALAADALDWAAARNLRTVPAIGEAHSVVARVRFERGDLAGAESSIRAAIEVSAALRITMFEAQQRALAVQITTARFGARIGAELVDACRTALHGRCSGPTARQTLDAADAEVRLSDGDLSGARALIEGLPDTSPWRILRARMLLMEGHFEDAAELLDRVRTWPIPEQLDGLLVLARCRPSPHGADLVREAAAVGVPRGYVRPFLAAGSDVLRLVRAAHRHGPTAELEDITRQSRSTDHETTPAASFTSALTDREQDVLRLLPTHLTYGEMAEQLCVSINTLKSYQKALFRKLHVPSRSAAVAAGREAGLISS